MANLTTEMMTIVSANTKPYVNAMNRGAKSTSMFSRVVTSSLGRVTTAIGGVVTAAGALRLAMAAIKKSADFESQTVAFEVALGSAEKAAKLMKDIEDFAASTPFQSDDLMRAAQTLDAFGVATSDIMNKMQMLGDVAAGSRSNLAEISQIYGQVLAAGKLTGERYLQFMERGIKINEPLNRLLEKQGVEFDNINDAIKKGLVSSGMLTEALKSQTQEGGAYYQAMLRQSETLNGLTSTLKDNFDILLRQMGDVLVEVMDIKDMLKTTIDVVQDLNQPVANLSAMFVGIGEVIGSSFLLSLGTAKEMVLDMTEALAKAQEIAFKILSPSVSKTQRQLFTLTVATNKNYIRQEREKLANQKALASMLLQKGGLTYSGGLGGAYARMPNNNNPASGQSFWSKVRDRATPPEPSAPTEVSGPSFWSKAAGKGVADRFNGIKSLLSFGGGMAGVGGKLGSRFMSDLIAASSVQMGPNSSILKGSSQAVSLEAERNRSQLDLGKSQLEELREIKTGIRRLVDFGIGQKDKAVEAFGGLF